MKKLFTIFLLSIFLLSLVSAGEECKVAQQGIPFVISAHADNATFINLTQVTYPNSSLALLGQFAMTKNGTNYNYSFPLTNTLGTYYYVTCGNEDGVLTCDDTEPRCFEVTPTGNRLNVAQMILYSLIGIVLIFLFMLCVYGGIVIPFKNQRNQNKEVVSINWQKYLKIFCWGMSYMLLIAIVFVTWNLIYAYAQWQNLAIVFRYFYRLLMAFALPTFIGLWVMAIINFINDKKIEAFIKRMGIGYNG